MNVLLLDVGCATLKVDSNRASIDEHIALNDTDGLSAGEYIKEGRLSGWDA